MMKIDNSTHTYTHTHTRTHIATHTDKHTDIHTDISSLIHSMLKHTKLKSITHISERQKRTREAYISIEIDYRT